MDLIVIWKNTLLELEMVISKASFTTWFRNTFVVDYKKGVYTIGVPTIFVESWMKKKYMKEIVAALSHQTKGEVTGVKFKIAQPAPEQIVSFSKDKVIHSPVDNTESKPDIALRPQTLPKNGSLNEYYTFDRFVVGASNQLAYAAAEAISNAPGTTYNPLFIYGESGLGKTHIMQAIGNKLIESNPDISILYVSSETFTNDYITAVESGSGKAKDFKNRYRSVDVLLIDDIQFLSGKEGTQEEFFHTFNHLHQRNKQVVLTADRFPKAIKGLEKRLQTRFEGGMVADISMPDLETRVAILRQKAKSKNRELDDEILHYIAQNIKSSIRELEGALTKVFATAELSGEEPTVNMVSGVLGSIIEQNKQTITSDMIIRETSKYFKIPKEDILGPCRNRELVQPRQVTMYLIRAELSMSYPDIGREMGGKDHTTIIHGCKKVAAEINNNPKLKEDIGSIRDKIRSSVG